MAIVQVHIVNGSGQEIGLTLDEHADLMATLKGQLDKGQIESLRVVDPSAKPEPKKPARTTKS